MLDEKMEGWRGLSGWRLALAVTIVGGLVVALIAWISWVLVGKRLEEAINPPPSLTSTATSSEIQVTQPSEVPSTPTVGQSGEPLSPSSSAFSSADTASPKETEKSLPSPSPSSSYVSKVDRLAEKAPLTDTSYWSVNETYNLNGNPLEHSLRVICYNSCSKGPALIEFDLGNQYETITATVGINDKAEYSDQVAKLTVLLDGEEYKPQDGPWILTIGSGRAKDIEIPVKNVLRIRFEVSYAGDDQKRDYPINLDVVIGKPLLHR